MSAIAESPVQLMTIGEVRRRLAESGIARSATAIRRWEERGVIAPVRAVGHDRRLYTPDDVATLVAALRASGKAVEAV
jgi:DNA-binding transcriptional MerR regulator